VHSRALIGLDARPVQVEVHLANGLPSVNLVGLADIEVKEARERCCSGIKPVEMSPGVDFHVNLTPRGCG
jgi:magnesium chelatase family protein